MLFSSISSFNIRNDGKEKILTKNLYLKKIKLIN